MKATVWLKLAPLVVLAAGLDSGVFARSPQAEILLAGSLPAQGGSRSPSRDDVLALLESARTLMEQGDLSAAEQAIADAESLNVSFGVFHLGDTPKKARRDLEQLKSRAKRAGKSARGAREQENPFANQETNQETEPAQPIARQTAPAKRPAADAEMELIDSPPADDALVAPGRKPGNKLSAAGVAPSAEPLLDARRALAMGDFQRASALLAQAKSAPQSGAHVGDSPARLESLLRKQYALNEALAEQGDSEQIRRDMLELTVEQADALLNWGEDSMAENLARAASRLPGGAQDPAVAQLVARIEAARGGNVADANAPRPLPPVSAAATAMPETAPVAQPSGVVSAEYQAPVARTGAPSASGVAPASFDFPVEEPNDSPFAAGAESRPVAARPQIEIKQQSSAPQSQPLAVGNSVSAQAPASRAQFYLQQGEAALTKGDTNTALAYFSRAHKEEAELSGAERARLAQHLTLAQKQESEAAPLPESIPAAPAQPMAPPAAASPPATSMGNPPTGVAPVPLQNVGAPNHSLQPLPRTEGPGQMLQEYTAGQRVLQKQISAAVANQQSRAKQMKEGDPKAALELLEQTVKMIDGAQVEPEFRAQLLRRVQTTREEVEAYYEAHRADIELEEKNEAVLAEVDREQNLKIEIDERLASLVDEYNQLTDEQRWAEAELVAKKAIELAPENPLAEQLRWNANFVRRFNQQNQIRLNKENGFVEQMVSVDEASTPFDDRIPFRMPDAQKWRDLTNRRKLLSEADGPRRNPREMEIEKKLKTPVSLQFTDAAIGQVLDHLAELADINIHIDPQGLAAEGVATDTTVTVNLKQEVSLKSALNLILEPLHLGYVIKDEVLKITSEQYRNGELRVEMYPVADLVIPIPNFVPGARMGLAGSLHDAYTSLGYGGANGFTSQSPLAVVASKDGTPNSAMMNPALLANVSGPTPATMAGSMLGTNAPVGAGPGGIGGGASADFDSLIQLITSTIEPTSWDEVGGSGAIEEFRTNLSLVVSQTEDVHDQIRDLLAQLRRLQDLQVTIEVRFITLNDNFFERIGVDFDFNIADDTDRPLQFFGQPETQEPLFAETPPTNGSIFLNPRRNWREQDFNKQNTTVVGMQAPGIFSADLDIPFRQNNFGLAVPQFGGFDPTAGASLGFAILSDIEAFFFINAAEGDRRTNVLQAPKVTLFNGQQATVSDTSQSPFVISVIPVVGDFAAAQQPVIVVLNEGIFMTVQATVSPDRRFVRLTIVPFFSSIGEVNTFQFEGSSTTRERSSSDGPTDDTDAREEEVEVTTSGTTVQLPTFAFVTVTTTVSVPDGGTILLGGIKRLSEGRSEFGVPILSKLPYINRLFRNVGIGRETQSLMMMVTPRIIIQEEEEALLGLSPTP